MTKFTSIIYSFIHDQEQFEALLNLFGCVDGEYTSHEIRGLNIVIRLVKTLNGLTWPRLIRANEKTHFIQYNFEAVGCIEPKEFGKFWFILHLFSIVESMHNDNFIMLFSLRRNYGQCKLDASGKY